MGFNNLDTSNKTIVNGKEIQNAEEYTYLGTTFSSNGNLSTSKQPSIEKTRRSIFACKQYLDFNTLLIFLYVINFSIYPLPSYTIV